MGHITVKKALRDKSLTINGLAELRRGIDDWFSYSLFSNPEEFRKSLG
jgi:hypothetical protein